MYKQSSDLRFVKNREALQRAFIDLTLEKRTTRLTVKELAERAKVNRMTFYAHYDEVEDILLEFVDEITDKILAASRSEAKLSLEGILRSATEMMQEEMEFYRLVAQDDRFELYRAQFRKAFTTIFAKELKQQFQLDEVDLAVCAGMVASGITYAYLDWLAGAYGDLPLEKLVAHCQRFTVSCMNAPALQA